MGTCPLPALPLEESHQLCLGKNVTLHGGVEFRTGCGGMQIGFCVKRVEPDEITVRFSTRRAGSTVPGS